MTHIHKGEHGSIGGPREPHGPGIGETAFEHDVRGFVLHALQDADAIVTCPSLTSQFLDARIDRYGPLGGWNVAAYIGVAQLIRGILRKNVDPEPDQVKLDLPEEHLLQDRYSVPGVGEDGEPAYVPRHKLTKEMMEAIVKRDRALSVHYARRADALESWWHRTFGEPS